MIVVAKNKSNKSVDYNSFGDAMTDGRITEKSDGKTYRLRDAIYYSKSLGRSLTKEEMKQFEITE